MSEVNHPWNFVSNWISKNWRRYVEREHWKTLETQATFRYVILFVTRQEQEQYHLSSLYGDKNVTNETAIKTRTHISHNARVNCYDYNERSHECWTLVPERKKKKKARFRTLAIFFTRVEEIEIEASVWASHLTGVKVFNLSNTQLTRLSTFTRVPSALRRIKEEETAWPRRITASRMKSHQVGRTAATHLFMVNFSFIKTPADERKKKNVIRWHKKKKINK